MSDLSPTYYVRSRGRVLGPFDWSQLTAMRDRGQLSQFHEVSTDRRSWRSAADLRELFSPGPRSSVSSTNNQPMYEVVSEPNNHPLPSSDDPTPTWFFAKSGTHHGPLLLSDLQRMADARELLPDTLVWKPGMENWCPANQISQLRLTSSADSSIGGSSSEYAYRQAPMLHSPSQTSGLAVASLVLGLVWLCGLGSLLAIVFGAVALTQVSRSDGRLAGKGMAIAGLVLGILGLAVFALPFFSSFLAALIGQARQHAS